MPSRVGIGYGQGFAGSVVGVNLVLLGAERSLQRLSVGFCMVKSKKNGGVTVYLRGDIVGL